MRVPSRSPKVLVVVACVAIAIAGGRIPAAHAAGLPLVPTLDCVWTADPHGPLAFFGYDNQDSAAVSVPVGADNFMSAAPKPVPADLGQPVVFSPGVTTDAFAVGLSKNAAHTTTWTLTGPDGVTRTVTATKASPQCASPPFIPSVSATGGTIGSHVVKQQYDKAHIKLLHAKVQFDVNGLVVQCVGGGIARPSKTTFLVSPVTNGVAAGKVVHLGVFPNDRDFWSGKGALRIPDAQMPPFPPYASVGMSDGFVAADVTPACDLGNGVVFTGGVVPLPRPPQPFSDAAPYCFVTDTAATPQVTIVGQIDVVGAPPADCPDVTTLPGGGVRWR